MSAVHNEVVRIAGGSNTSITAAADVGDQQMIAGTKLLLFMSIMVAIANGTLARSRETGAPGATSARDGADDEGADPPPPRGTR